MYFQLKDPAGRVFYEADAYDLIKAVISTSAYLSEKRLDLTTMVLSVTTDNGTMTAKLEKPRLPELED